MKASFLEAALFVPPLQANRPKAFDRHGMDVSKDHYIGILPFTWVGCTYLSHSYLATTLLFEVTMISMLGYQVNEFIEAVATLAFVECIPRLHELIDDVIYKWTAAVALVNQIMWKP